jgi:putative ABC transport system permease protein
MMISDRVYRLLLWLYPAGFRRRFGPEMVALFLHRRAIQPTRSLWWSVAKDTVRTIPAAWLGVIRPGMRTHRTPFAVKYQRGQRERLTLGSLFRDIRFALRNLKRTPAFTIVAVATLGLGVGANAAIFSVVNGVMLKPLPYPAPHQLAMIWRTIQVRGVSSGVMSQPNTRDIQRSVESLRAAAFQRSNTTVTGSGDPEVVTAARVTDGLFDVLGVAPVLGRDIRTEESVPGGRRVVVIGHAFWQERFGGRDETLGTTIELAGRPYEIVGVAPPAFDFPNGSQLWLPLYVNTEGCGRGCSFLRVIARLDADATHEAAQAELNTLAARLREAYPEENAVTGFRLEPLTETVYGDVRTGLFVLLGAVGIVLLIACANVANLLLVRASSRTGEVAVRAALGASRGRLIGQLLLEATVLAVLGGTVGLGLARAGLGFLLRLAPSTLPRVSEIAVDTTVLLFVLGTVTAVTFLFGLAPALRLSRVPVAQALNHGGRGGSGGHGPRSWARSALLIGEVGLSLMLLFGAGLLLRTFSELNAVELGFDHQQVLTFEIVLPDVRYETPDDAALFFDTLEERLRGIPGVESVGGAVGSPMSGSSVGGSFLMLDRPPPPLGREEVARVRYVTSGYFDALRIPMLQGRAFSPADRYGTASVALVSESFAALHYPDKNPVGEQLELQISFGYPEDEPRTIVGVVKDIRSASVRSEPRPEIYVPYAQSGASFLTMVVQSIPSLSDPLPAVRAAVRQVDPNIAMRDVETLTTAVERSFGPARFYLSLLTIFAGVAVLLAAIGLYGVIAYLVSGRTREIGIRMALGANGRNVVRMVLVQGLRPAAIGVVLGIAGTLVGSRVLTSLLFNVTPWDATTLMTATGILLGVVVLAILLPASRASRIPPVEALKLER